MKQVLLVILALYYSTIFGQNLPNVQAQTPAIGVNAIADVFSHSNYPVGHYSLGWYLDSWNPGGLTGYLRFLRI